MSFDKLCYSSNGRFRFAYFLVATTILKIGLFFYFSDVANGYDESFGSGGQQCEICYKVFPGKAKLRRHYLIHTGEKPFKCELCKQTFNQKPNLKRHMIMHISRFWSDSSLTQFTSALYYCYVLKVTAHWHNLHQRFTTAIYWKWPVHWHNLHQRFTTAMYWKWHAHWHNLHQRFSTAMYWKWHQP